MELGCSLISANNHVLDSRILLSSPKLNPHPSLSCYSLRLSSLLSIPSNRGKRFASGFFVDCSSDYSSYKTNDGHDVLGTHYPRPSSIPWKKELCNYVQLIGTIALPVQIKHLSSGKAVAWTRLAVKKSQTDTSWINLTFWDELAHTASQHVEKGNQVYVCGRLVSDSVDNDDGKQETYYKVVVQQLHFVERNLSPVALYDGKKNSNYNPNSTVLVEELWQAFFANPVEWWDNRKNKKSPNYPDFKHKDTGEALWIEGRNNPSWVKSQLAILDSRMENFYDQNARMQMEFMGGDNFMPF